MNKAIWSVYGLGGPPPTDRFRGADVDIQARATVSKQMCVCIKWCLCKLEQSNTAERTTFRRFRRVGLAAVNATVTTGDYGDDKA